MDVWTEYDWAAEWCAEHGYEGALGDPLPPLLSDAACRLINMDPEAFAERVRAAAYALAREGAEEE